jgi:hypothetical protein
MSLDALGLLRSAVHPQVVSLIVLFVHHQNRGHPVTCLGRFSSRRKWYGELHAQ